MLAVLVALPVLAVGANLFAGGTGETWAHLLATVLPEYVANSIWLCLGVGIGVAAIGTGAAWLVALNDFPGRRIAEWALLLPMANSSQLVRPRITASAASRRSTTVAL